MMTDNEILRAIKYERIKIKPFDIKKLGPVSYDITTLREDIAGRNYKLVSTEEITLSKSIAGLIGLRSKTTKKGIWASFSPLIDPGFKGHLIFLVQTIPFRPVDLHHLFQIMFFKLGTVNVTYNKRESSTAMDRRGF